MALVPVVLVAGALAGCTPTPGGTASATPSGWGGESLQFDAVSGRNNRITVSLGTGGVLLLTDSENPVTPGSGCTRVNDNTVRCGDTGGTFVTQDIQLGDGNDTFANSVAVSATTVDAGVGDDTVNFGGTVNLGQSQEVRVDAGAGDDTVTGGDGRNVIHAGAGNDTLNGGAWIDVFFEDSDGFDRDVFSGGTGRDSIHYAGVTHAVNVSLNDVADDGRPGEADNVKSDVEDIMGSGNADTLTGDGDGNAIYAFGIGDLDEVPVDVEQLTGGVVINSGGGSDEIWGSNWGNAADRLTGGTSNDTIYGFAGDDVLSGGPGNDHLEGRDGFDALDGGSESDYCDVGPDGGTAVNCETGPSSK